MAYIIDANEFHSITLNSMEYEANSTGSTFRFSQSIPQRESEDPPDGTHTTLL